jgi:two-component system CheB/CheR fusion protein
MTRRKREPDPPLPGAAAASQAAGGEAVRSAFAIVGVGASAGGLEAFRQMLNALPVDTGMAFVLVQHLSPTHASLLAEILSRTTALPVTEVRDEPWVEPNHVYVIPPDRNMIIVQGSLRLLPREGHGQHRPIDYFFRSLAKDQGPMAMGVILSGTASDGTLGLEEIKAEGGITFAQDDSAQQSSMPRSAVASGCVDFVLSPEEIARQIARIALHPFVARAPLPKVAEPLGEGDEADLAAILRRLREVTGVDFSQYKPNTFHRRIARRMVLHQVATLKEYARRLAADLGEVQALYQDVLVNVTSFFRDPEVFEALKEKVLPALFKDRSRQQPLRVWVPGCSTGEEAYSLAMVIAEFTEAAGGHLPVQIFATDLNETVIEGARKGVFPLTIAHDVSPERLQRFFAEVDGHYRIAKTIREECVFARHNVLIDPPFSQIDLITCRNLLIYMEPSTQRKILPLLHYALKPTGFLVLGSSETAAASELFEMEDARHKIFTSRAGRTRLGLRSGAGLPRQDAAGGKLAPMPERGAGTATEVQKEAERILLSKYAPPGVVIDADLDILLFHGDTGPYLAAMPGKASLNLLKMAREGLPAALRSAISKARKDAAAVRKERLRVRSGGEDREVHLEVIPLQGSAGRDGAFLVLFEEAAKRTRKGKAPGPSDRAAAAAVADDSGLELNARLSDELHATREYLRSVIAQQDAANEDLQSASEELQSANEELQSINEELETSKEEIQSTNEELTTVNDELQNRNQELNQSANDMINLLGSVDTAILMLGPDLCIRRFTPAAEKILRLIAADLGRPIAHVKLSFELPDLEPLLAEVLATGSVLEREVRDPSGRWYLLRVRPYRTLDNRIDGAVIMLVDIDRLKSADQFAKKIVATVREALLVLDADLRVQTASSSFYQTFQMTPEAAAGRRLYDLGARRPWDIPALRQLLDRVLAEDGAGAFEGFEVQQEFDLIGRRVLLLNARRLAQQRGDSPSILFAIEDVTERRALEEALGRRVEELAAADRSKDEFLALLAHELRNPLAPLRNSLHLVETAGDDQAVVGRALEVMHRQIGKMARLIDDLLDVSRLTRGSVLLRKEPVELAKLLEQAVDMIRHEAEARGQTLTLALPPGRIHLDADATRLEQVFGNLLHNATKFTGLGGHITLTAEATGDARAAGEVVVRVRDDGIGIAPEMLPRVFDLFMQAQRSLDRSQGGLGIGLTLVKSLVELHGGKIEAHSAGLEQGTELVVRLPLVSGGAGDAPEVVAVLAGTSGTAGTVGARAAGPGARRVLVVDDNVDTAESLAALLRLRGHEVEVAFSGPMALDVAASFEPETVLLDIGLPGLDGYEVAASVRRHHRLAKTTLVALTGYGQEADRLRAREAGFDHYLTKPVDPLVIYQLLEASG